MDFRHLAASRQSDHIAPPHIGNLTLRLQSVAMPINKIVDDPFTNSLITDRHLVGAGEFQQPTQDNDGRKQGIDPFRIEPGNAQTRFDGRPTEFGLDHAQVFQPHLGQVELRQRPAGLPHMDYLRHIAGHSGCGHHGIELFSLERIESPLQGQRDRLVQLLDHGFGGRGFRHILIGQANRAEPQALGMLQPIARPDDELDRSATHIHHQRRLVRQRHAVTHAEKNQPGFFNPADHADLDPGLLLDQIDKIAAVFRFTHGTGRDCRDAFKPLVPRQGHQRLQDTDPAADGFVG